jgi:hypothetical protein
VHLHGEAPGKPTRLRGRAFFVQFTAFQSTIRSPFFVFRGSFAIWEAFFACAWVISQTHENDAHALKEGQSFQEATKREPKAGQKTAKRGTKHNKKTLKTAQKAIQKRSPCAPNAIHARKHYARAGGRGRAFVCVDVASRRLRAGAAG